MKKMTRFDFFNRWSADHRLEHGRRHEQAVGLRRKQQPRVRGLGVSGRQRAEGSTFFKLVLLVLDAVAG